MKDSDGRIRRNVGLPEEARWVDDPPGCRPPLKDAICLDDPAAIRVRTLSSASNRSQQRLIAKFKLRSWDVALDFASGWTEQPTPPRSSCDAHILAHFLIVG